MEIAPTIYGVESLGGWKAVVMAHQGNSFATLSGCTLDYHIVTAMREAVGEMHGEGWVHGTSEGRFNLVRRELEER